MKSGYVSIVGRPNVGKSTLLNAIIGEKIAITSNTAQTTRNVIEGIYTEDNLQIVFVDTPGIHKPEHKLGRMLNKQAYDVLNSVDLILFMIDVRKDFGKGDNFILDKLRETNTPVILILNKIDTITYQEILPLIAKYKDLYPFEEIIPISAYKHKNIDDLIKTIAKYIPESVKLYDDDEITNVSTRFIISEYIREKVLYKTHEEIPHSVACTIDLIEEDRNNISISASVIVDRENLKKILIGKNGSMIKDIGISARKDIEEFLGKKVYLDLRVKVINNWRDKDSFLKEQIGDMDISE